MVHPASKAYSHWVEGANEQAHTALDDVRIRIIKHNRLGSPSRSICVCIEPWPDAMEEMRPAMDKALKAYRAVIDEAASRGNGRKVRDKREKFNMAGRSVITAGTVTGTYRCT